jgi:predicted GNAT family N-acyltransferase
MEYAASEHLDTEWRITHQYFGYLQGNRELHVSDDGTEDDPLLHGAVVLSERYNQSEWDGSAPETGMYVGKLATANVVRGTRYVGRVMLPSIVEIALSRGKESIRLNYRGEDTGLGDFYEGLGFEPAGANAFYSGTRKKEMTTVNMIKKIS